MAILVGAVIPAPARAEGKATAGEEKSAEPSARDMRKKVRKLHEDGLMHYNLGEYEEALEAFTNAYRLRQDPVFLFNIGQTYRQMNTPQKAAQFYRAYLRMRPDAPNREAVERFIADAEASIRALEADRPPTGVEPPGQERPGAAEHRAGEGAQQATSPSLLPLPTAPEPLPTAPGAPPAGGAAGETVAGTASPPAGVAPPPAVLPAQEVPPPGPPVALPPGSDLRSAGVPAGAVGTYVTLQARSSRAVLYQRSNAVASRGAENGPGALSGTEPRGRWQAVCGTPCGLLVDRQATYRIAGPSLTPSRAFHFPAGADRVEVRARTGTQRALAGGVTLLGLGVASLVAAPILWNDPVLGYYGYNRAAGLSAVLVGIPLVATGLPLVIIGATRFRLRVIDSDGRIQVPVGRHAAFTPAGLVF
jgi:hypothetical protein